MPCQTYTDPLIVREVLAYSETHYVSDTAEHFNVTERAVVRWRQRRRLDPAWPDDAYVERWHSDITPIALPPGERHGTMRAYGIHKCRCRRCRQAASAYEVRRKLAQAHHDPLIVSALGTKRRLQALQAIGWTWTLLAPQIPGATPGAVRQWLDEDRVTRTTARRVAKAYDHLCLTPPATPDRWTKMAASRARNYALRNDWPPPLAWNDIDDPDERPRKGLWKRSGYDGRADLRIANIREMDKMGLGVTEVMRHLGLNRVALEKYCDHHDLRPIFNRLTAREDPNRLVGADGRVVRIEAPDYNPHGRDRTRDTERRRERRRERRAAARKKAAA